MTDYAALLPIAREAVAIAHRIIRRRAPLSVTAKGERDMVTDVDLAVEEAVRAFLDRETPEIGLLGEEFGGAGGAGGPADGRSASGGPSSDALDGDGPGAGARDGDGLWWVLDPVDGTANLARGIPLCAASLGLMAGRRSVLGVIDLPFLDTTYAAVEGNGAFAADRRIGASGVRDLAEAVISIGDFAVGDDAEAKNRVRIALLRRLGARAQRIRMIGTAAIDLAWVAHGKLDACVILANLPWDTMAGTVLVREAGGVVVDQDGTDHTVDAAATIAVCPGLHAEIMTWLRRARDDPR